MKAYVVYVNGVEQNNMVFALNQKAALEKAQAKYPDPHAEQRQPNDFHTKLPSHNVDVVYTEV